MYIGLTKIIQTILVFGLVYSLGVFGESVQNIKNEIDTQVIKQEIMADLVREKSGTTTPADIQQTNNQSENLTGNQPQANIVQAKNDSGVLFQQKPKSVSSIGMMDYIKVIGSLIGILALFILCVNLVRRASKKIHKSNNLQMEIVSRMAVAPKRELILARIGDETILVGSSEAGLNFMTTIDSVGNFEPRVGSGKFQSSAEEVMNKLEMKDTKQATDYRMQLKSKLGKYKPLQ